MDGFALVIGYVTGVELAVMNCDSPVAELVTKFSDAANTCLAWCRERSVKCRE